MRKSHDRALRLFAHLFIMTSAIVLLADCQTWRPTNIPGGGVGGGSSLFSVCEECSLKRRSNHSGYCCCTPLLDIHCERLSVIPEFFSDGEGGGGEGGGVDVTYSGIYMSDQQISEIPDRVFANLKVRKIVLNFNPIKDNLSKRSLKGLEQTAQELHLGDCKISYLPDGFFEGMSELRYVHLWQNSIEKIPPSTFNDCSKLRELILWGNRIRNIDSNTFAGLWTLRKLDLDKNLITTISREAFRHLGDLEVLHLGENQIKALNSETFVNVPNLKVLNLDGNRIDQVNVKAFSGLHNLVALALNGNRIHQFQSGTFNNLHNMTSISLQNNSLDQIWPRVFDPLPKLQKIDLSRNRLSQIRESTFSSSRQLRYLYLENNLLKTLNRCILSKDVAIQTISIFGNNNLECDCRVTWLVEMHEKEGVKVWGSCGRYGKYVSPTAIVSRFQYKLLGCKNSPVECKR